MKLQQNHILHALQCKGLLLSFITEALEHILLLYEQRNSSFYEAHATHLFNIWQVYNYYNAFCDQRPYPFKILLASNQETCSYNLFN